MRWRSLILVGGLTVALACDKAEVPVSPEEQLAIDIALIDQYLDDNGITAVEHPSGLRWVIQTVGSGEKPTSGDCVRIGYSARLLFETVPFEEVTEHGAPMSSFILGWRIGLKEVSKGGSITLYIPSALAYGTVGQKKDGETVIPANSVLVFEVNLLNITEYNSAGQYCYPWPS